MTEVGLLTGGGDRPYAFGLAMALVSKDVRLDFIASDQLESPELRGSSRLNFLNLRGSQRADVRFAEKISRVAIYYARLIRYALTARPKVFHILWNNKFEVFDRTLLILYYKALGKKIVLTAHNINAGKRDSTDSLLNRLTLRIQYRLADHIFVHTDAMKRELIEDFGVRAKAITVVAIGINNSVPDTDLTPRQAKRRLGIADDHKTILFFGHIGPYKGLDVLVAAFQRLVSRDPRYRLIIAGKPKVGGEAYLEGIQRAIRDAGHDHVIQKIEFIPDEETELYFKAADVLALPYVQVFQSGVLVLGYTFGLPVVAADVGSLREDIVEGGTGFLCRPRDPVDLARALETYFESALFKTLDSRRQEIREYARERHSWDAVSETTRAVYRELLGQ
jgi:D-inositol-3-phosphate glycosyltransferase